MKETTEMARDIYKRLKEILLTSDEVREEATKIKQMVANGIVKFEDLDPEGEREFNDVVKRASEAFDALLRTRETLKSNPSRN